MLKPRIFVGSSSEGLRVARAIQIELGGDANVTIWNQGCFSLGEATLESLVNALRAFEFAILVITADDRVVARRKSTPAARDNVLFELGLFMGRLGQSRTFVFYDSSKPAKIISDLQGITFATFDGGDSNLQSAVGPGCTQIRNQIARARVPQEVWYTEFQFGKNLYRETLSFVETTPEIAGSKVYEHVGGRTTTYAIRGFRGKGFDWLEYHTDDGGGGGAVLLRHLGAGLARGLIVAGHCDTGALRCYENRWVAPSGPKYDPAWLKPIVTDLL
jgi:hypothetical protein